jgi:hypothetical protein
VVKLTGMWAMGRVPRGGVPHGDRNVEYVLGAENLKQARIRYKEQFGIEYDDPKIMEQIEERLWGVLNSDYPTLDVKLPQHLVLAILLRQPRVAGGQRGRSAEPEYLQTMKLRQLWAARQEARRRIEEGENPDDVFKDIAKRSALSETAIRDGRLYRPQPKKKTRRG